MMQLLSSGRRYSVGELAQLLEVSPRMVRFYRDELEKAGCADPDDAAEPFAHFLGQLFSADAPEEAKPSLRFMGYNIGKWIYWLDAVDDYDKDEKTHPLRCIHSLSPGLFLC